MTGIIDYGVGNLFSLKSSLAFIGEDAVVSGERSVLSACERILLPGVGAYSGKEHAVLLSVVSQREVLSLKKIVRQEDKKAFMFITDTHETLGEGFEELGAD